MALPILALVLFAVLALVVGLGRMVLARQDVNGAAGDAARAASLERNTALSAAAAQEAAEATLTNRGVSCADLEVATDVSAYEPGGQVAVTVTCVADLADVALSGLPASHTFTATAIEPIEQFRGVDE